jgi:hypothetical protein
MEIRSKISKKKHLTVVIWTVFLTQVFGYLRSFPLQKFQLFRTSLCPLAADSTMYIRHCLSMHIRDKKNELILCTGKMLFLEIPQKKWKSSITQQNFNTFLKVFFLSFLSKLDKNESFLKVSQWKTNGAKQIASWIHDLWTTFSPFYRWYTGILLSVHIKFIYEKD